MIHCDNIIYNSQYPLVLRYFLLVNRLPALEKGIIRRVNGTPSCYATYEGKTVRLTMASRFGDVGITEKLDQEGYDARVHVDELCHFRDKP